MSTVYSVVEGTSIHFWCVYKLLHDFRMAISNIYEKVQCVFPLIKQISFQKPIQYSVVVKDFAFRKTWIQFFAVLLLYVCTLRNSSLSKASNYSFKNNLAVVKLPHSVVLQIKLNHACKAINTFQELINVKYYDYY